MEALLQKLIAATSEAWIGVIGAFVGSLITTFGVWLTNRANAKQVKLQLAHTEVVHRQRIVKDRLEELYLLICQWQRGMFANYLNLALVMKAQIDYNQYLDSFIKNDDRVDFSRLEMIINVYGLAVRPVYIKAIEARSAVNEITVQHKRAYKNNETGLPFLEPYTDAQRRLDTACDDLKEAVANVASRA